MSNRYLSIFSTQNLQMKNKEIEKLWEKFVTKSWDCAEGHVIRNNIVDSWKRCQSLGVDPQQVQTNSALTESELQLVVRNSELYQAAKPILDHCFDRMKETGYLLTLSNEDGYIIYLKGEKSLLRDAEKMNFAVGMDWSETGAGTNAIGTSIATNSPIQIFSAEHFCQGCHPWTCSSAPITHPITKKIIGAVDFTGFWNNAQPHTLGLAISTAQIIENRLAETYLKNQHPALSLLPEHQKSWHIIFQSTKKKHGPWNDVIGTSESLLTAISKCYKASPSNVPILLLGESGTGKEKIAVNIHKSSQRHNKPFIAVNCGTFQKELIGSELFGYEKGAFTGAIKEGKKGKFEEADGGTLFLDEIGEMTLDLQVHLLRALQEKEVTRIGSSKPIAVNVRIVAATNKNLYDLCKRGLFREDLFFRLNVITVTLPPLRERKEDIPLLIEYFLDQIAKKYEKSRLSLTKGTVDFLIDYTWPGNIRELQNVLEHAVIFCESNLITLNELPPYLLEHKTEEPSIMTQQPAKLSLKDIEERKLLLRLLKETGGNLSAVAKKMNIARSTLYRKLKKYQLN